MSRHWFWICLIGGVLGHLATRAFGLLPVLIGALAIFGASSLALRWLKR